VTESRQTSQINHADPPLAGNCFAVALVAATAGSIDLATIDNQTINISGSDTIKVGAVERYVTIVVDGVVPIYVIFGANAAAVTAGNAPVIATVGTNAAGICIPLYPSPATGPGNEWGAGYRFRIRKGYNSVLGFISSGTPTLRIFASSPYAA
jgi:hypothetical protein